MTISYSELYYASTQLSLLTGVDGFGVRTHTKGIPTELIERLKARNLFFYEAGNKMLCGVFDLINNPALVEEYPQTYALFREKINDQTWRVCVRTIFLGRDYGWYLEPSDQNARSGNTFTYAVFAEESPVPDIGDGLFLHCFRANIIPRVIKNTPDNPELRALLTNKTGKPDYLSTRKWDIADSEPSNVSLPSTSDFAALLMTVYRAVIANQKVVVLLDEAKTQTYLTALLYCMPQFLCRLCTALTNHHHFNLETDYRFLFINEFHPRKIDAQIPGLIVCDCRSDHFLLNIGSSDTVFFNHLFVLLGKNDIVGIHKLMQGLDAILQDFNPQVSFDQLYFAWQFLINRQSTALGFEPQAVLKQIDNYLLRPSFRESIRRYIISIFQKNISEVNHTAISDSLKLVDNLEHLNATALREIQLPFTDYFLKDSHATTLARQGVPCRLIFPYLTLENRDEDLISFIENNKDMLPKEMDDFILEFCSEFQDRAKDYLFWLCLDGNARPSIGDRLLEELGDIDFFDFLEKNRFFDGLDASDRKTIFNNAIGQCFTNLYHKNKDNFIDCFRRAIGIWPSTADYLDHLTETATKSAEKEYEDVILLLETYDILAEKKSLKNTQLQSLEKLLFLALNAGTEASVKDLGWLQGIITLLEEKLQLEKSNRTHEPAFVHVLHKLQFMIMVLGAGNDPDYLNKRIQITPSQQYYNEYLRFVLVASQSVWDDKDKAKILAKMLVQKFGFVNNEGYRFLIQNDARVGIASFIPFYMAQIYKNNPSLKDDYEHSLANFYCNYTLALWGQGQTVVRSEDAAEMFFKRERLLNEITDYLQNLNATDSRICQSIVQALLEEKSEELIDLQEHLKVNIPAYGGISLTNIFSKFKSPFKRQ